MTSTEAEKHQYGMCDGACRYCYEQREYEDHRASEERRAAEEAEEEWQRTQWECES